ncbi:MAG: hypothetical protein SF070_13195 [Gemmatimonadota bacterium]|nr:hypothetical protein [Gemmatimonadota bacterium]
MSSTSEVAVSTQIQCAGCSNWGAGICSASRASFVRTASALPSKARIFSSTVSSLGRMNADTVSSASAAVTASVRFPVK